ncbi:MAG: DUF4932 domain-containing protein [Planctomycetes bacterium]|nr:DUF4932 domain-containing protein [Planctomycetota bacterium]
MVRTALLATVLTAFFPSDRERAFEPDLSVRIDPCVELMSIVFRFAGNPEYGKARVDSYASDVETWFGDHRDDPVVRLAADLRRRNGVSFDAVMGFAVHLDGTTKLQPEVPLSPRPASLDERWKNDAPKFLRALQKFATRTRFAEFFEQHQALYDTTVERMRARLAESAQLGWFEDFFGARPTASFEVSLGLLNGGQCYGPHVLHKDGTEDLHCVLGVWATDDAGLPTFDEDVIPTVVHEFCHSYCNHQIDAHEKQLVRAGTRMFAHVEEAMRRQAYGSWQIMLKESLVRACVIRYEAKTRGPRARDMEIRNQERCQFYWAGDLSDVLIEYEKGRESFATLANFMPRVVEFFDEYSKRFEAEMASRPQVVSTVPEIGDQKVDPNLEALVITFNTKMADRSWAFVGGGPKYPKTKSQPHYDEACKVLTLAVELEPDHEYEFWLNRGKFDSFRSATGKILEPVRFTFRTAKR